MNYRVVWQPKHQTDLATYAHTTWETGGDADAIPRAIEEIEWRLSTDPLTTGEYQPGGERVLVVEPLSVTYEVFRSQQVVLIYEYLYHPGE